MFIKNGFHSRAVRSGFTLIELVMFIVIVSIAVIGILQVMNVTTKNSADPQLRKQALSIAEALLEEVSLARFTFCDPADPNAETAANAAACAVPEGVGPENGNVRPFDNVNDYVAAYGVAQPIAIADVNAIGIPNLANYAATIKIVQQAFNGIPATDSLLITVSVAYGAETITLDGYRTRYAPNLMP
ncbi:PilV family protein [Herminiimonas arsenitoxidans]|uniref:MSHA biogenesis protein MshD n=1 Tax=Herminiimonas arsenitoxidans TaxID=1809410 RepID=UPI0009710824|nr:MSHA biogenesis protein MshD [Herminiimonas arsenitoxidans]